MVDNALQSKQRLMTSPSSEMPRVNDRKAKGRIAVNSGKQSTQNQESLPGNPGSGEVSFRPIVPKQLVVSPINSSLSQKGQFHNSNLSQDGTVTNEGPGTDRQEATQVKLEKQSSSNLNTKVIVSSQEFQPSQVEHLQSNPASPNSSGRPASIPRQSNSIAQYPVNKQ